MGIVKIYNVLGGFYSYYSITLASESVNKHAQVFDYFLCSFTNQTTLSRVRTLRCLALKNASLRETFSNETSGIRTPDNLIKSQVLYHLS